MTKLGTDFVAWFTKKYLLLGKNSHTEQKVLTLVKNLSKQARNPHTSKKFFALSKESSKQKQKVSQ